jgi:hypothetical protein
VIPLCLRLEDFRSFREAEIDLSGLGTRGRRRAERIGQVRAPRSDDRRAVRPIAARIAQR